MLPQYYAWEAPFKQKINKERQEELRLLKLMAYVVAVGFTLILFAAPIVQPILIFFTYASLGTIHTHTTHLHS